MKIILSAMLLGLLALFSTTTFSDSITIPSGLTATQQAQVRLNAAKMAEENAENPISPQEVKEWASIGDAIGDGIVNTASKLGVEVNNFATSPVGIIAVILIAWTYIGDDLMGIMFGFFWFSTMVPVWVYLYRRKFSIENVEYFDSKAPEAKGRKKVINYYEKSSTNSDTTNVTHIFYWISIVLISIVGIAAIFAG